MYIEWRKILSDIEKITKDTNIINNDIIEKLIILVIKGTYIKVNFDLMSSRRKNNFLFIKKLKPLEMYPNKKEIC